jgi:hypothetical protein
MLDKLHCFNPAFNYLYALQLINLVHRIKSSHGFPELFHHVLDHVNESGALLLTPGLAVLNRLMVLLVELGKEVND